VSDSKISALTRLPEAAVSPTDLLPIVDLSASETKAITAKDLLEGVVINLDPGSIPVGKIDFASGSGLPASGVYITKGDVVLGRGSGAGPAAELPCTAAGRALLAGADAAAQRNSLGLGSLALRSGSWVDGSSFSGTSSGTNTGDQTITLTGPVTGSGKGTFATTITPGAIGSVHLGSGSVITDRLATDAVTADKLADHSSTVVLTGAPSGVGGFLGQGALNSLTGVRYTYTSGGWKQDAGVQSVTIRESGTPLIVSSSGTTDTVVDITLDPQLRNTIWAGPTVGANAVPSFRLLVPDDLPLATATTTGTVKPGSALQVDAAGGLNLKPATPTDIGGVKVIGGGSLNLAADGTLKHEASPAAADTYVKVTTDATGHVVAGVKQLSDADITSLDAGKLTTGTINPARFGVNSIPNEALNHYSTVLIQEGDPGKGKYIGQLWYKESDAQLRVWSANSWIPVGFGRLSQDNLRFCGTWLADTGNIETLTGFGTQAGFVASAPIPTPTDAMAGAYFVTRHPGTHDGVTYDNGDWILCLGRSQGWVRIDTLSGVAGGGATHLDDLLDVTLATLNTGDTLIYDAATGIWVNRPTAARKAKFAEAMDGTRTTFTMDVSASSGNNLLISLGGVIQEPGADFSFTAPRTVNFAVPPPAGIDNWVLVEGVPSSASGTSGGGTGSTLPTGTAANEFLQWATPLSTWLPKTLPVGSDTVRGGVLLASAADITAGTAGRVVDAAQLKGYVPPAPPDATDAVKGLVELATAAETTTGTDATRAVTPAGLKVELDKKAPLASPALTGTPTAPTAPATTNSTQIATTAYVTRAITTGTTNMVTGVTGTAPIAATVTSGVAAVSISAATTSAPGSMSAADKTKLDGIAAGAEVNVQPDWTQADNTKDDFIKNKPATFTPPIATATVLGGVKQGTGLAIDPDGTIRVNLTGGLTYKGLTDPTKAAPATPANGDVWIASAAGSYEASWGLSGTATKGEMLIYEGGAWDAVGQAASPIKPDWNAAAGAANEILNKPVAATDAAAGLIRISTAAEVTAGTSTTTCVTPAQLLSRLPKGTAADQYLRWDQAATIWVAADDILGGTY